VKRLLLWFFVMALAACPASPLVRAGNGQTTVSVKFAANQDGSVHIYGIIDPYLIDNGSGNGYWITVQTFQANGTSWIYSAPLPQGTYIPWDFGYVTGSYSVNEPGSAGLAPGDSATVTIYWYDTNWNRTTIATGSGTY